MGEGLSCGIVINRPGLQLIVMYPKISSRLNYMEKGVKKLTKNKDVIYN